MQQSTHLLYSNRPQCSVLQTNIMQLKVLIALIFATLAAAASTEDASNLNDVSTTSTPQVRGKDYVDLERTSRKHHDGDHKHKEHGAPGTTTTAKN